MNKRQREIQNLINQKATEAENLLAQGKSNEAAALLDETDELKKEFDLIDRVENAKKGTAPEITVDKDVDLEDGEKALGAKPFVIDGIEVSAKSVHDFAKAARAGFPKSMNEGTGSDGGYTVPEDILTLVEHFRDAKASLRDFVRVENVTTDKGRRTYQTRAQVQGFAKVGEGNRIPKISGPTFAIIEYDIDKYAGWLPVTNELIEDSDADITRIVAEWLGEQARVTDNKNILEILLDRDVIELTDLDGITYAFDVVLGQAFASTSKLYTNDIGKYWLNTLKDGEGRGLLQPDPTAPKDMVLASGANRLPVIVLPIADLPSEDIYDLTTDAAVVDGKTYYTRSGSGTSESPYVYTAVENPQTASIGSYYDKFAGVPFLIGDAYEAAVLFDRRRITVKMSDVASAGQNADLVNAFDEDLTLFRGTIREDVVARDTAAVVRGRVILPA